MLWRPFMMIYNSVLLETGGCRGVAAEGAAAWQSKDRLVYTNASCETTTSYSRSGNVAHGSCEGVAKLRVHTRAWRRCGAGEDSGVATHAMDALSSKLGS